MQFKEISNVPGYVFALLNYTVIIYMQSGKIEAAKNQINSNSRTLRSVGRSSLLIRFLMTGKVRSKQPWKYIGIL